MISILFLIRHTLLTAFDPYIAPYTTRALFVLLLVLLNKLPPALYSTIILRISYPPSTLPYLASKQMDLGTL